MNKDEFPVVIVMLGIGFLLVLAVLLFGLFGAGTVRTVHGGGGCNNAPLVNGQTPYPCISTAPAQGG